MCVEVERVQYEELKEKQEAETSAVIQERVCRAREIQVKRYSDLGILTNSELNSKQTQKFCVLDEEGEKMMRQAFEVMQLTARKYYKILTVARTIADLDQSENIKTTHLREALSYRMVDTKYWGGTV